MDFAAPLGTRAALASRIAELLPGTAFDAARPVGSALSGPPSYAHVPSIPNGVDAAEARRILAPQLALASGEVRDRIERLKELAAEFRGEEAVHQLLQFRGVAAVFPASAGENGYMRPERLSDPLLFETLHTTPRLPAWFGESRRDGYEFTFAGEDCTWQARMVELGRLCYGFVYAARPLDAAQGKESYALFSSDQRVHYRSDGTIPNAADPTGDSAAPAPLQAPEVDAVRDLHHVAAIESLWVAITRRGY